MNRKLAEDLIQSNDEYTKLPADLSDGSSSPERRRQPAPGVQGLGRPELETWPTEELRRAATTVGTPHVDSMRREELVEALLAAELASVRGR
jgi:hypothetical protein